MGGLMVGGVVDGVEGAAVGVVGEDDGFGADSTDGDGVVPVAGLGVCEGEVDGEGVTVAGLAADTSMLPDVVDVGVAEVGAGAIGLDSTTGFTSAGAGEVKGLFVGVVGEGEAGFCWFEF